jgi:hypothetical protein
MSERPRTEAGRRLLDLIAAPWKVGTRGGEAMIENVIPFIVAIEDEAAPAPVGEQRAPLEPPPVCLCRLDSDCPEHGDGSAIPSPDPRSET